ncbi:MAG: sulfatase-like hydrolase/transferase [Pseudomonadota bacterium]
MILTDDMGWGDVGVYGHPDIKTPVLDELAGKGALFTQFYVSSPVCSPSRASLLTGRFAPETGIHYAIGGPAGDRLNSRPFLDDRAPTLYDVFRDSGYLTGHFGKWHLGGKTRSGMAPPPSAYGLDVSATTNSTGPQLTALNKGDDGEKGSGTRRKLKRHESSAAIVDHAIQFIESANDKPFFVSLWTREPHAVLDPTSAQMAPYREFTHSSVSKKLSSALTVYYASITNLDTQIGRLIDYLDEQGLRNDTIIVFTSDNGPAPLWATSTAHSGAGLTGPFRGVKGSLYEGGIRMPFIVSWRGKIPDSHVDDSSVVAAVDLLPTLAALAGIDDALTGMEIHGEDLSTALLGEPKYRGEALFWEYRGGSWGRSIDESPRLAMREGDWKLLSNPDGTRVELYNLAADHSETSNVAAYEAELVQSMQARLFDWYTTRVPDPERSTGKAGRRTWKMPVGSRPERE